MPQFNGLVLALFLITDAHPVPFFVVHQRGVFCRREATFGKFHRRPDVHQRHIVQEQVEVVVGIGSAGHINGSL